MKVVTEEHVVPARTYVSKKYVASDGIEFAYEDECIRHERRLEIKKHPVMVSRITDIYTFDEEYYATLYYIANQDDYDFLIENPCGYCDDSNYDQYGPGWYLYWCVDMGDYPERRYLVNYNAYEAEIEQRWRDWKSDIHKRMREAQEMRLTMSNKT